MPLFSGEHMAIWNRSQAMLDRDSLRSALIKGWETLVFPAVSDELLHLTSAETITFGLCVQSITLSPPAIIGENQNTDGVS